jgi:hypothetical protein
MNGNTGVVFTDVIDHGNDTVAINEHQVPRRALTGSLRWDATADEDSDGHTTGAWVLSGVAEDWEIGENLAAALFWAAGRMLKHTGQEVIGWEAHADLYGTWYEPVYGESTESDAEAFGRDPGWSSALPVRQAIDAGDRALDDLPPAGLLEPAERIALAHAQYTRAQAEATLVMLHHLEEAVDELRGAHSHLSEIAEEVGYVCGALERPWPVNWFIWIKNEFRRRPYAEDSNH